MDKPGSTSYGFGPFRLDTKKRILFKNDEPVALAPKAFDLLLVLIEYRGQLLVKDELMEKVWHNQIVEDANLTVNMSALRKALGENPHEHLYIVTIPGRGYRFVANVTRSWQKTEPTIWETDTPAKADGDTGETNRLTSIAVLPFKQRGANDDEDYLGLGLADALITRLSHLRRILVRPTSAVLKYSGLPHDPITAGRDLRVNSVLEGSIWKSGEKIRVTAQLVSVADEALLWAEKFDESFTDLFAVEDSVSEQVARSLAEELSCDEAKLLTKRYTDNIEAYQCYLKGRYQMSNWTTEGLMKAVVSFQEALAKDPQYARAYVGLAEAHASLGFGYGVRAPAEEFAAAKTAARNALKIDSALAEAHASLAEIEFHYDWNWSAAKKEYKRAIALNPNLAKAHQGYAFYLAAMGRIDEAMKEIKLAEELDPLSLVIKMHVGLVYYGAGEYQQAIRAYQAALEIEPNFSGTHALLGWVYEKTQQYAEAIRELEEASRLNPVPSWRAANLAHAYAISARHDEAVQILEQLKKQRSESYISPFYIAEIYVALGDAEQAFEWLEKAYAERDSSMAYLKIHDRFENLFSDPRYQNLLQRMGLNS